MKVASKINAKIIRKKKDYDKNICWYIARSCIRSFVDRIYKNEVLVNFCNNNEDSYNKATTYFLSQIEHISGHKAFKKILTIT